MFATVHLDDTTCYNFFTNLLISENNRLHYENNIMKHIPSVQQRVCDSVRINIKYPQIEVILHQVNILPKDLINIVNDYVNDIITIQYDMFERRRLIIRFKWNEYVYNDRMNVEYTTETEISNCKIIHGILTQGVSFFDESITCQQPLVHYTHNHVSFIDYYMMSLYDDYQCPRRSRAYACGLPTKVGLHDGQPDLTYSKNNEIYYGTSSNSNDVTVKIKVTNEIHLIIFTKIMHLLNDLTKSSVMRQYELYKKIDNK